MPRKPKSTPYDQIPERLGELELVKVTSDRLVRLVRNTFYIPSDIVAFYKITGTDQFVLNSGWSGYCYAGMDESPFLTLITEEAFEAYTNGGKKAFYDFLKPKLIHEFEKLSGQPAKRQGDIFAVPLPWDWERVEMLAAAFYGDDQNTLRPVYGVMATAGAGIGHVVFSTNHILVGRILTPEDSLGNVEFSSPTLFGEGTLAAEDHAPLQLDGPHLMMQSWGLAYPEDDD